MTIPRLLLLLSRLSQQRPLQRRLDLLPLPPRRLPNQLPLKHLRQLQSLPPRHAIILRQQKRLRNRRHGVQPPPDHIPRAHQPLHVFRPDGQRGVFVLPHEHAGRDLEVAFAAEEPFGRADRVGQGGGGEGAGEGMGEVGGVGPEVEAGGGAGVAFDCDEAGVGFDEVEGDLVLSAMSTVRRGEVVTYLATKRRHARDEVFDVAVYECVVALLEEDTAAPIDRI